MVEFHQLVQEISCLQDSLTPTPTPTQKPTPTESALKPRCPPLPLCVWGGGGGAGRGDINISNGFDVTERSRVCGGTGNFQCSKGNDSKTMQSTVTVPALCTSSDSA